MSDVDSGSAGSAVGATQERTTVRMELAAAPHHSAGPVTNDAARNQKTVNSRGGWWPRVFEEPEPAEECGGSML